MPDSLRRMLRLHTLPVLTTAALGIVLVSLPPLARLGFDFSHYLPGRPAPSLTNDVAVILANEHTVVSLGDGRGRIHWEHHIRLLDRLTRDRARLVFCDFIFSETNPVPALHQQLADAVQRHGSVVLVELASRHGAVEQITPVVPPLDQAAAARGPGHLPLGTVRNHPGDFAGEPAAIWKAAAQLDSARFRLNDQSNLQRWLHYYGPPPDGGLPVYPYENVLSAEPALAAFYRPGFFAGKIVFIGQTSPAAGTNNLKDTFDTPYSLSDAPPAAGVILHATALLNLLRGESLRAVPLPVQCLLAFAWAVLLNFLLIKFRCRAALVPVGCAVLAALLLFSLSLALQWHAGWWWSWPGPVLGQTAFALFGLFRWWPCQLPYLAFLSYRTQADGHLAELIADKLKHRGYRVRRDVDYLTAGRLEDQILRNLEQSQFFIPILSPGSLAGCKLPGSAPDAENPEDWILKELKHALRHGKIIVPIFTRDFNYTRDGTIPDLPAIRQLKEFKGVEHKHNDPAGFWAQLIQFLAGRRR